MSEANDISRNKATHHMEPWSEEEHDMLQTFWGLASIGEIAEALGRTIEACRQRHYELEWAKAHPKEKVEQDEVAYMGWIVSPCDCCGRCTDVFRSRNVNGAVVQYCEDHL